MVSECYQCYRCANGCPVADDMDITPHGIIGCIIRGHHEKALSSGSIWTCVQCLTCSSRCPNGIEFACVSEALLRLSATSGLKSGKQVRRFDKLFIESVVSHGRFYELGVILRYRLYKNEFREDVFMGLDMLKKGRIGIFPHNIRNKKHWEG